MTVVLAGGYMEIAHRKSKYLFWARQSETRAHISFSTLDIFFFGVESPEPTVWCDNR